MKKILMMSVREDEKEAIENWSERHPDVEVGIDEGELHADTVAKLKGFDGVVIQQRSLVEDEGSLQLLDELPAVECVQEVDVAGTSVQYLDGKLRAVLHVDPGRLLVGVAAVL